MKNIVALLTMTVGLLLTGCATTLSHPRPVEPDLTAAQKLDLRSRLDRIYVGMGRTKALEILNIESFGLPVYQDSNGSGMTLSFPKKHVITISTLEGDYDYTIRWIRFDGEMWPQNNEKKRAPQTSQPTVQPLP